MGEVGEIFSAYYDKYAKEEIPVDKLKQKLGNSLRHLVLYGSGSAGIGFLFALRRFGIEPVAFLDGNPAKRGSCVEGLMVYTVEEYAKLSNNDTMVVVCINIGGNIFNPLLPEELRKNSPNSLIANLKESGYDKVCMYDEFWRCYKLFEGEIFPLPSCCDVKAILDNQKKIEDTFDLIYEKASVTTFLDYLYFRLINNKKKILTYPEEQKYFSTELFTITNNDCFVDCGAFSGNTLKSFIGAVGDGFKGYVAFEPDTINFDALTKFIDSENLKQKVRLERSALYNNNDTMNFYEFGGPGSLLFNKGQRKVPTITLDSYDFEYPPTYIKLNVEGAEVAAIEGGHQLIATCKPIMCIRLLKISDLWDVPLLLQSLNSDYHFFFRSYMNHLAFFLYAVPVERLNTREL